MPSHLIAIDVNSKDTPNTNDSKQKSTNTNAEAEIQYFS